MYKSCKWSHRKISNNRSDDEFHVTIKKTLDRIPSHTNESIIWYHAVLPLCMSYNHDNVIYIIGLQLMQKNN